MGGDLKPLIQAAITSYEGPIALKVLPYAIAFTPYSTSSPATPVIPLSLVFGFGGCGPACITTGQQAAGGVTRD